MNYRHRYHAGNFADVAKHALLVALVRALQRKPRGALLLDTHAGSGSYELAQASRGDSLEREPEHPGGIGRVWAADGLPGAIAEYVRLVREFDAAAPGPSSAACRRYPGSPWLFKLMARPQDRLALCELHPEEALALRGEFSGARSVSVHEMDGYAAPRAMLPPPERRGLILIDPPYEAQDEGERVATALSEGLERFPSGLYALWYPLTARAGSGVFLERIRAACAQPALAAEICVDPGSEGLRGCGLVIVNPPWKFEGEAAEILGCLERLLARSGGASSSVSWLVPEKA